MAQDQLGLWNAASAHVGVRETITSVESRQLHALVCAQFEATAVGIFMSEFDWSFSAGEAALHLDSEERTVLTLDVHLSDAADLWFYPTFDFLSGAAPFVAGDVIILDGQVGGYTFDAEEFRVGLDDGVASVPTLSLFLDTDKSATWLAGTNAYSYIDSITGSTAPANGDSLTAVGVTCVKKPVSSRWSYQYRLPSDYCNARQLYGEGFRPVAGRPIPYELSTDNNGAVVLLTDLPDARLVYTKTPSSYALLPPSAYNALTLCLAKLIAFAVTRDKEIAKDTERLYNSALHTAIAVEGNSQKPQLDPDLQSMQEAFDGYGQGRDNW